MDNKIIKSFIVKDTLNPKVWNNPDNIKKAKLKPEVKKGLLDIANEFIDFIGVDFFIEDIEFTGSLANYNWSEYSDYDLHIIFDETQFKKSKDVYLDLFKTKKLIFNEKHNLKIKNYPVEVYPQPMEKPDASEGKYSLLKDEWVIVPKKDKPKINKEKLKHKIIHWVDVVNKTLEDANNSSLEVSKTKIKNLSNRLDKFRKSGLQKGGEFSNENLVYKYLRRSGLLDKVFNYHYKKRSKELSIENELN